MDMSQVSHVVSHSPMCVETDRVSVEQAVICTTHPILGRVNSFEARLQVDPFLEIHFLTGHT